MSFILGVISGLVLSLIFFSIYCYKVYNRNRSKYNYNNDLSVEIGILNQHTENLKQILNEHYKQRKDVN